MSLFAAVLAQSEWLDCERAAIVEGMNPSPKIEIHGRHLELTESIKERVRELASKLLEHDAGIDRITVEVQHEPHSKTHHDEYLAKGRADDGKYHLNASASGDDLYKAIRSMGEKLDRLVRRLSRKRVRSRRHAKPIELAAELPKAGGGAS